MLRVLGRYPYAVFLALDLLVSAITFGAPWMTISARLAKAHGVGHWSCVALDWFVLATFGERKHCEVSLQAYAARMAAVVP